MKYVVEMGWDAIIQSIKIKFPNWRYCSNNTNVVYWRWTELVRENIYLYDVQVPTGFFLCI
jgi:hypothetical protein